jgi:hypothetical protein
LLDPVSLSTANDVRLDTLARHLLDCAVCAQRWEIIQSNSHVDLAELYALERLNDDLFVKLRAEAHLRYCSACQQNDQARRDLILAENPRSVHYGNLVALLRQMPQLAVVRSEPSESLTAIIMENNGQPSIRDEQLERVKIPIVRALLTNQGRLTVELNIPPDYSQAQLAVSGDSQSVMVPHAETQEHRVEFVADTRVQGSERKIAPSQLAVWVTRRHSAH